MPLIRIESRPKSATPPRREPQHSRGRPPAKRGSLLPSIALGAVAGLLVVAVAGLVIVRRDRAQGAAVGPTPAALGADASTAPTDAIGSPVGDVPTLDASVLTPIPGDRYLPTDTIAWISGQPYLYADLLRVVRVARVLGYFTGDAVPSDTSPEMPGFQVQMLRRQIDLVLLKQEMQRQNVEAPPADDAMLIDAFLRDSKITREQLDAQMAANGVSASDLGKWFADASAVNFFIQNTLAQGKQGVDRDALVKQWLDQQWAAQNIVIQFYDPDEVLPGGSGAAPAVAATVPPAASTAPAATPTVP